MNILKQQKLWSSQRRVKTNHDLKLLPILGIEAHTINSLWIRGENDLQVGSMMARAT